RAKRTAFLLSLTALLCLGATQVIFWTFTYPMNAATNNWTVIPQDFEAARLQWEYSHAVNAVLTFLGAGDRHPLCVHLYARLKVRGGLGLMSVSIVLVERVGNGRFVPLAVRGRPEQR